MQFHDGAITVTSLRNCVATGHGICHAVTAWRLPGEQRPRRSRYHGNRASDHHTAPGASWQSASDNRNRTAAQPATTSHAVCYKPFSARDEMGAYPGPAPIRPSLIAIYRSCCSLIVHATTARQMGSYSHIRYDVAEWHIAMVTTNQRTIT